MRRTLARWLLAGFFLFHVGCYNTETLSKDQLRSTQDHDITVKTNGALRYRFSKHQYSIVGDSLSGVGVQIIDVWPGEDRFKGSIPLSNIASIRNDEFNSRETIFIVAGSLFVLMFVGGALVASGLSVHH